VKLAAEIRDHDDRERRLTAALHGVALQDRHGQLPGRRQQAMANYKARRRREGWQ
jgi:hypothetical protein